MNILRCHIIVSRQLVSVFSEFLWLPYQKWLKRHNTCHTCKRRFSVKFADFKQNVIYMNHLALKSFVWGRGGGVRVVVDGIISH